VVSSTGVLLNDNIHTDFLLFVTVGIDIPYGVFDEDHDTRVQLCSFLTSATKGEDVSNTWIYNSLIGSFMIGERSTVLKGN
jgi:hypothetical protein